MKKEKKKIDFERFLKGYSKQIDPIYTNEINEQFELSKMHLNKIINLIDLEMELLKDVFEIIINSKNRNHIERFGGRFLNFLQLSAFYSNLLGEFLKELNKKIKHLKKHKNIESIIIQQYLMDALGILEIAGLAIRGMEENNKAFNEFLKKSNFDENDPQYEELIKLKLELEEMEKKIKSHNKKLFEFKM